jgi:hypothetical protein
VQDKYILWFIYCLANQDIAVIKQKKRQQALSLFIRGAQARESLEPM